jgi:hypothetical protein
MGKKKTDSQTVQPKAAGQDKGRHKKEDKGKHKKGKGDGKEWNKELREFQAYLKSKTVTRYHHY